jgi:uncharacterized protein (DUF1810 family)
MNDDDPFDLQRFVTAQSSTFPAALQELKQGRKRGHWMWFIFPQLRGLGRSSTAMFYGIASLDEARAYLAHGALGPRLILCTEVVVNAEGQSLHAIFGSPDDMKFRSSMTLFACTSESNGSVFQQALDRHCGGVRDEHTVALLQVDS